MRNLKLLHTCFIPALHDLRDTYDISIDPDTGRIFLATANSVLALDPQLQQVTHSQSLLCDAALQANGRDQVVGLQFLPDQNGACVAISNGNLTLWTLDINELECVGSVESGLTAMRWSPDHELLVLTTGVHSLLVMTREFDAVTEVPLHSTDFGEGEFITVGWGRKETQFHGSEGKQAAHRQKENAETAVPWDDRKPRICWRGDGQFFAVSSISDKAGARCIRVWSREGVLQSTSEALNGLEQAMFWKPSGALIASTQRKPNKYDVVFFERNGLQHGEFTLSTGNINFKVLEVMWNMDSTILAVWGQQLTPDSLDSSAKLPSFVQLWTSSNYHWSLKQTLDFSSDHGSVVALTWDPEHAGRLHIITSEGHYLQYNWTWVTSHSLGQTSCDPANVFVIDGSTLKVTPMRKMVVPPPMSAYRLSLRSSAVLVVSPASPPTDTGDIGILTHDNHFQVFRTDNGTATAAHMASSQLDAAGGDGFSAQCSTPALHATYRLVMPDCMSVFPLCVTHICWPRSDILVLSIHGTAGVFLCATHLPQDPSVDKLELGTPVPVEQDVISLTVSTSCPDTVVVQLASADILRFTLGDEMLLQWKMASGEKLHFPYPCVQMELTTFNGKEEAVIGLTDRFRLYVNGIEFASNCTSFALHNEFLLLTTLSHTVRCISRLTAIQDLPSLSDGKAHPFDESVRRVERGSRIVTVVAEDTKLIMQMPRGNLETIHPRALVLATVRRQLDRFEFGSAFAVMKKHRINLNLLYDHNPSIFLQHITQFLEQVPDVTDINLFLTELQEEDVTITMYTAAYNRASAKSLLSSPHHNKAQNSPKTGKVDTVCDAVRQALEGHVADRYRLTLLTTYVKKTKPELQKALEMVWQLKASGETADGVNAEEALKFLLFLVDVNKLYDAALATYNFDLVLMVAEKSQKDPKEYIPFLNNLRRLEDNYCKFTIDKHLKNYSLALQHIASCADHLNECVDLVQEHKLYTEALKLFPADSHQFKTIARNYGHYLLEKNRPDEAGVIFLRAEFWQEAHDAFLSALNWRQAVVTAIQLHFGDIQMAGVARGLADRLRDHKRYSEAAIVYEQYVKDVEEAIVTLIQGAQWEEALRLMYSHRRTDIIETHLKEAINEACQETMATLERQQSDLERYVDRLVVVRTEKEQRRQQLWNASDIHEDMNADLFSETSSMTGESIPMSQYTLDSNRSTVFSKISGRSGRNRRKAEHKKWSLKEGSPLEECALIEAISKIITATDAIRDEVNSLLRVMVQFHEVVAGEQLQDQYEQFLNFIQHIIPTVWLQREATNNNMVLGPGVTANLVAQAMQQGQPVNRHSDMTASVLLAPPTLKKEVRWKLHMLQMEKEQ